MKDRLSTVEGHLSEARLRIIVCLVLWVIVFGIVFCISGKMLELLTWAYSRTGICISMLSPTDIIVCETKMSAAVSVILSLPVILYQIRAYFEVPVPKKVLTIVYLAFLLGGGIVMCTIFPVAVDFFCAISNNACINPEITLGNASGLCIMMYMVGGLVSSAFVSTMFLVGKGVLRSKVLRMARPAVYVAVLVFSALFSPPDVLSMLLLACPMIVLYEICVAFSRKAERRRLR